jgi:hypothetical protein
MPARAGLSSTKSQIIERLAVNRSRVSAMLAAVAVSVVLFAAGSLHGQWRATGPGPFRYEDPENWESGIINDKITNNPGSDQAINLTTDRKMPDGILVRRPAPAGGRAFALHFRARNGDNTADEPRTLSLSGPVTIDFGNTNDQTAFFGESVPINFDFGDGPAIFQLATGNSHIQIRGAIFSKGMLVRGGGSKEGGGRLLLAGKQSVAGGITLDGAHFEVFSTTTLTGIESLSLVRRSSLILQADDANSIDLLPESVPIVCSGATEIRLLGGKNKLTTTIGRVFFGQNCLELWASGRDGGAAELLVKQLVRVGDGLLIVGYERPASGSRVRVQNDATILNALVGGRGGQGSTAASIIPWARGHGSGNLIGAAGFVTFSRDGGFRELDNASEYIGDANTSTPADNVRINAAAQTLLQSRRINSLYLDFSSESGGENSLDLSGNTLTLVSGALSSATAGQITNGTLTTGSALPLVISGPLYMNARLVGTGGLIYFGGRYPDLRLASSENTLAGDYVVTYGALRLGDAESIPDSVIVRLHGNGKLVVEGSESITGLAGSGDVSLVTRGRSRLMLGFCEGIANQVIVGAGGEVRPGDVSKGRPAIGELTIWPEGDPNGTGSLEFEDGTLFVDLATSSHDAVVFGSEDKSAHVEGGTLHVNLLNEYRPRVGAKWEIIKGTAPASGPGFESIVDGSGRGYHYVARPIRNSWVLELVSGGGEASNLSAMANSSKKSKDDRR